jgi:hypothetical protein
MKSVYLGQYTDEVANLIGSELERAKIRWSYKQAGRFTKVFFAGEWGTRLFVEDSRIDEARQIAERVTKSDD